MDTLLNIRAFLAAAAAGSLSAAGRQLGVSPSVIAKRIDRLEDEMRVKLFIRSTRKLELTETAHRYIPRYRNLLSELDDAITGALSASRQVEGHLRIKCPTTITTMHFGDILSDFQLAYPKVSLDIVQIDRSVNPVEEGFDMAFGALPASYAGVLDEPLCAYPRLVCAAPSYLAARGAPEHPRDLLNHDCLAFTATGLTWQFGSPRGSINVEVPARLCANDSQILRSAAVKGLGIAMLGRYIARDSLERGELVPVLDGFTVPELWLKALIPREKAKRVTIQALLSWVRERLQPHPPWELDRPAQRAASIGTA